MEGSRCKVNMPLRNLFAYLKKFYIRTNFFGRKGYISIDVNKGNMPANKNALIRYKTIDNCLRNPYRRWTLEDLVEACSDALYEMEGISKGVSVRTVQSDIQMMRSDKLGYNAPIEVYDHKYYRYAEEDYSIMNMPMSQNDYDVMQEAVDMLRQLEGFEQFSEMSDVVSRLQDKLSISRNNRKTHYPLRQRARPEGDPSAHPALQPHRPPPDLADHVPIILRQGTRRIYSLPLSAEGVPQPLVPVRFEGDQPPAIQPSAGPHRKRRAFGGAFPGESGLRPGALFRRCDRCE